MGTQRRERGLGRFDARNAAFRRLENLFRLPDQNLAALGAEPENLPENSLFKRPFLGYFFYLVQDIGASPFSAVLKYDVYDPNTKVSGNEVGAENSFTSKTDLAQSTIGIGGIYNFNKHIRLQAYYEFNFNEKSNLVKGYENDWKDNVLTVRLQYKF